MITLYAAHSPNVVKVCVALEELGLAYEALPVDVMAGRNFDEDFVRLNPNAKVPVIVDPDGPEGAPITIFESGAILIYLAEKAGRLIPRRPAERYSALEWLMVQMSGVGPIFGQFVHFELFAPNVSDYARSRYKTLTHRIVAALEARLDKAEWLAGSEYSIADVATYPWVRPLPRLLGAEVADRYPRLIRWAETIEARPAVVRALSVIDEVGLATTTPGDATPEALDRVFGRGEYTHDGV